MTTGTLRKTTLAFTSQGNRPAEAIVLTLEFRQDGQLWLAECLELGTATFADSLEGAQNELVEAVELQLNEVSRLGFVEGFLADHHIQPIPIRPAQAEEKAQAWTLAESMAV